MSLKTSDLPQWYDRKPKSRADVYLNMDTEPVVGDVERFSYTCPDGKMVMVEVVETWIRRHEAATTLGTAYISFAFKPVTDIVKNIATSILRTNIVNNQMQSKIGSSFMMFPGDKLTLITYDGSTGGTVSFYGAYKLTEFDAIPPIDKWIVAEEPKLDIQQPRVVVDPPM